MSVSQPPRKRIMVRNYALIWADSKINDKDEDCQHILKKLRELVGEVKICVEPAQCIQYINDMNDEKVFIISSGAIGQHLVPQIHFMRHVDTIYVFCNKKTKYEQWAHDWCKIKGVYTSIKPICESLKKVVKQCDHDSMAMTFLPKRTTLESGQETQIDQLEPSYMYTMLFKDIILETGQDEDKAVADSIAYFSDKGVSENELKLLQSTYHQKSAIWWYTCEIFLYSTLNKALRNLDMEVMVKMGFIIRKLHLELKDLCHEQSDHFEKKFIVYRGQGMFPEDFQHLLDIKGGLLSFNCFLSTSTKPEVANEFMAYNLDKYKENVGAFFCMTIEQEKVDFEKTPFALIEGHSASQLENEVLFSMHTVFRVNEIKQSAENKRRWDVQLTITNDNDPQLGELTARMKEETQGYTGWYRKGKLMLRVGDVDQAERLYNQLLEDTEVDDDRAQIYYQLGRVRWKQGRYKEEIEYYQKSIEIQRKTLNEDDISFANAYNNIGLAYNNMGDYKSTLEYYGKSHEIYEKVLHPTHPNLASSYSNIGQVYYHMGEYSKTLEYYEKALKIRETGLPPTHPDVAASYNNIGLVYNDIGEYSKALEYYEKALKIIVKALPPTHPMLAATYNNIGLVYDHMGEYSKALEYYEKTLKIEEKTLPSTHPDLAISYGNLGRAYRNMGNYLTALDYFSKTHKIFEESLPENHPHLATSCSDIGDVYNDMCEYSKALEYYEKSLNIREKALPPTHSSLIASYWCIGDLYKNMGEYSKSLAFLQKALDIQQLSLPPNHPNIKKVQGIISDVKKKM